MQNPKVSICIFSYNYEKYIDQAINSVLNQKTNFRYEIIIGDDFSTDNTRKIITEYREKYPEIIKLSFNDSNIGGTKNWIKTINACTGKYIALLDGDDYFTNPLKLQKQFECLEDDSDCNLSFHAVEEVYDQNPFLNKIVRCNKPKLSIEDFIAGSWFIRTSATFFRNGILPINPPDWIYKYPYRYDSIIHVLLTLSGSCLYLDECMSVWRRHSGGVSNIFLVNPIANLKELISLDEDIDQITDNKFKPLINKKKQGYHTGIVIYLIKTGRIFKQPILFLISFIKMDFKSFFKQIINKILNVKKATLGQ